MRSQPDLPLKAMSESVTMQYQGLVSTSLGHITIREYGDVPVRAAARDDMDVQGLCITAPTPHWMRQLWRDGIIFHQLQHSGERSLRLTQGSQ